MRDSFFARTAAYSAILELSLKNGETAETASGFGQSIYVSYVTAANADDSTCLGLAIR